jgi:hypothetical protein
MKVHINHWLPTKEKKSQMHVQEGLVISYEFEEPRIWKLTMYVCGMCRLALGTLARVGKRSS